jgi:aspartate/methionine/tyrosine aminotransferase
VLFIDPGFPVQKQQCRVLGIPMKTFDVYEYRGDKLRDKLEEELKDGDVACLIYSSPNNPAWFCFTDHELKIIGEMANKYGVVVLEDDAYFLMDFRKDYSVPGKAPFQPTVAKYTDRYVLMISGSKSFSYAGERIAMMICSPMLYNMECPDLARYYSQTQLGRALIFGTLYCLSSGTAHSVQYAMAAMLKGANDGTFNFVQDIKEYGEKKKTEAQQPAEPKKRGRKPFTEKHQMVSISLSESMLACANLAKILHKNSLTQYVRDLIAQDWELNQGAYTAAAAEKLATLTKK